MFRNLVNAVNRHVSMATLPSDRLRLNASKSESLLAYVFLNAVMHECTHRRFSVVCKTQLSVERDRFHILLNAELRQILDRRTSMPKVLSVLRVATVLRSTEI